MLDYQNLISDTQTAKKMVEGSYMSASQPVVSWEKGRGFIADYINSSGTILDIGCANGFLLKSLQAWSKHALVPYGIDKKQEDIIEARRIFPDHKENFFALAFDEFLSGYPNTFPEKFNFIYWGVWVNFDLTKQVVDWLIDHIVEDGRLILGFYPDKAVEPSDIKNNIGKLVEMGYKTEVVNSPFFPQRNEKLAFIDC